MSQQIREMDDVLPEDVEFHYRGEKYVMPGDIDVATTYALLGLLQKASALVEVEQTEEVMQRREQTDAQISEKLLGLFRQRHPDMKELPFGVMGQRLVLTEVLIAMGFEFVPTEGDGRPPTRTTSVKSRRSRPSRSSSKASASRTGKS